MEKLLQAMQQFQDGAITHIELGMRLMEYATTDAEMQPYLGQLANAHAQLHEIYKDWFKRDENYI